MFARADFLLSVNGEVPWRSTSLIGFKKSWADGRRTRESWTILTGF